METKITTKTKKEIAMEYFPFISPHSAVNQLSIWFKKCPQLIKALTDAGYKTHNHYLTSQQVALVYEYLGAPG